MATGTSGRPPTAACNERSTLLDTTDRDVCDEVRARVSTDEVFQVLRDLDDPLTDRFAFAAWHRRKVPSVTYDFGTIAVSTTVMFAAGLNAEKYAAAVSISAAEAATDNAVIAATGSLDGTDDLRAPLLKSAICWTM